MKKFFILILLLAACGDSDSNSNNVNNTGNNQNNSNNANNANNQNNASAEFTQIAAILASNCGLNNCHGNPANKAYQIENGTSGSDADVFAAIDGIVAATGRQLIEPGDSSQSEIYLRLTAAMGLPIMPATGALPDEDIETIRVWIDGGASF